MRRGWLRVVLVLAAIVGPAGPAAAGDDPGARAKATVQTYFDALNEGNTDRIAELYHRKAVFLPKNAPAARGRSAIAERYRKIFQRIDVQTSHKYFEVRVDGNMAMVESQSNGTVTIRSNGEERPTSNNELFVVLKNTSGDWKIYRYMFNGRGKAE